MSNPEEELKLIVEAALFAAEEALSVARLVALFPRQAAPTRDDIKAVLAQLEEDYADRGIELKRLGKGYRFQSREKYSIWLRKLNEGRAPRYTRALLETLAIIAYRQPVTRGDIEEIRGVTVSPETMRTLLDREWIKQIGQRDVPGRPALFGTTQQFLEYFNLASLSELPALMEKRQVSDIAREMNLTLPFAEAEDGTAEEGSVDPDGEEGASKDGPAAQSAPESAEIIRLEPAAERVDSRGERKTP